MDKLRFTQYCNTHMRNLLYHSYEWPDLYWRRIIRLGRAWAKHGSSCDNPSVYKYGQADGSSVPSVLTRYPRWFVSQDGLSRFLVWMDDPSLMHRRIIRQARSRRMTRLQYLQYKSGQYTAYHRSMT